MEIWATLRGDSIRVMSMPRRCMLATAATTQMRQMKSPISPTQARDFFLKTRRSFTSSPKSRLSLEASSPDVKKAHAYCTNLVRYDSMFHLYQHNRHSNDNAVHMTRHLTPWLISFPRTCNPHTLPFEHSTSSWRESQMLYPCRRLAL